MAHRCLDLEDYKHGVTMFDRQNQKRSTFDKKTKTLKGYSSLMGSHN